MRDLVLALSPLAAVLYFLGQIRISLESYWLGPKHSFTKLSGAAPHGPVALQIVLQAER